MTRLSRALKILTRIWRVIFMVLFFITVCLGWICVACAYGFHRANVWFDLSPVTELDEFIL